MPNEDQKISEDRKFLHDLATPITVAKMSIKRVLAEMTGEKPPSSPEHQRERLEKALKAIADLERFHADRRIQIYEKSAA